MFQTGWGAIGAQAGDEKWCWNVLQTVGSGCGWEGPAGLWGPREEAGRKWGPSLPDGPPPGVQPSLGRARCEERPAAKTQSVGRSLVDHQKCLRSFSFLFSNILRSC